MKIAVIGTWHVHTTEYVKTIIASEKAEIACIWDCDSTRGAEFAKGFDLPFEPDLNKILDNKEIDSVIVCSATDKHPEDLKAVAKAGKNIFTEKVLAFTVKEAEEIAKEISDHAGKFTIALFHKTYGKVLDLKAMCDKKLFGDITYIRVRNAHNGAIANWLPAHFYDKAQCGGGAMMDLGAHPMYLINWFMGEPISINSCFTSVTGKAVEDNAVCTIEYPNGAIAVSETGFVSQNGPYVIEVNGSKGGAMIVGDTLSYCCEETDNTWKTFETREDLPRPLPLWIDAVADGTEAPFGLDEAIGLTKLMEGAYISHETGAKYVY